MAQKIDEQTVKALWGDENTLRKEVDDFARRLKDHAKTKNIAAPTAHPFVEVIVRKGGGAFEVVPSIEPEPLDKPRPEIDPVDLFRSQVRSERQLRLSRGVTYNGARFSADLDTIGYMTALIMTTDEGYGSTLAIRSADGNLVELERDELVGVVRSLCDLTQHCLRHEYALYDGVDAKREVTMDATKGWPADVVTSPSNRARRP